MYDNMKIQKGAALVSDKASFEKLIAESDELISIFVASIKTATSKLN